jgi:hypothetical protein
MRTVIGIFVGIVVGVGLCGFGPCVAIDQVYRQERAEQGDLEMFALRMLVLFGGGIVGATAGAIVGGLIGARKDRLAADQTTRRSESC